MCLSGAQHGVWQQGGAVAWLGDQGACAGSGPWLPLFPPPSRTLCPRLQLCPYTAQGHGDAADTMTAVPSTDVRAGPRREVARLPGLPPLAPQPDLPAQASPPPGQLCPRLCSQVSESPLPAKQSPQPPPAAQQAPGASGPGNQSLFCKGGPVFGETPIPCCPALQRARIVLR